MNNIFFKKCLLSLNVPNMIIYGKPFLSDEILNYYHDINNIDHIIEKQFNNLSYKSSVYHYEIDLSKINRDTINIFYDLLVSIINHKEYFNTKRCKTIIFYNCDKLKITMQSKLRVIIEKYRETTIFIFICYKINKIIEPIKSRCILIRIPCDDIKEKCFIIKDIDKSKVNEKNKIFDYQTLFSSNKDKEALKQIVDKKIYDFKSHYHILCDKIIILIKEKNLSEDNFKKIKECAYHILKYNLDIPLFLRILLEELTKDKTLTNNIRFKIVHILTDIEYKIIKSYKKIIVLEKLLINLQSLFSNKY